MLQTFHCATCGLALTGVQPLTDPHLIAEVDAEPRVPKGYFFVENDDCLTQFANNFIVNLTDLRNTRRHTDSNRLNGCCGLDGCDGRNLLCANEHEIGTEQSDCWLPHSAALDPQCVMSREAT